MIANAKDAIEWIDPIIGVTGKDAEVTFYVTPQMIQVGVTDCTHVAHISAMLPADGLQIKTDKDITVTVNISTLYDALKSFADAEVEIDIDGESLRIKNKLGIRTMRLLSKMDMAKRPSVDYDDSLSIVTPELRRIASIDGIGEGITLTLANGEFVAYTGSDTESASVYLIAGHCISDRRSSTYPSEMLASIIKRIRADKVSISLKTNYPLYLNFEDGADYHVWLAPRIEEA